MATTPNTSTSTTPIVTRDPRFAAGRNLVKKGLATEGAIDVFATLVEEATAKYGESSIETSPAYYEYGNALLRAAQAALAAEGEEEEADDDGDDKKMAATTSDNKAREAAAAAAERRLKQEPSNGEEKALKEDDTKKEPESADAAVTKTEDNDAVVKDEEEAATGKDSDSRDDAAEADDAEEVDGDEEEGSDLELALEMMENAFSIMEEYSSNDSSGAKDYKSWVEEQLPRVLTGLGDVLSTMTRHADAADAYSRALELRRTLLESRYGTEEQASNAPVWWTVEHLQARRQVVEATVLIAEELLSCDPEQDVVTTETSSLIVKAEERVEYARGYYDKARDALQETVFLMGQLAAKQKGEGMTAEKENVCFIATLVMGVGTTLAAIDEEKEEAAAAAGGAPPTKKAKKS